MELAKYMIGDAVINGVEVFEEDIRKDQNLLFDKLPNKRVEQYYRSLKELYSLESKYIETAQQVNSIQAPKPPVRGAAQNKQGFFAEAVDTVARIINSNDVDVTQVKREIESGENKSKQFLAKKGNEALDMAGRELVRKKKELLSMLAIQAGDSKEEANIKRFLFAKLYERAYFNDDNTNFSLTPREGYTNKTEEAEKLINKIEASAGIKEIVLYNLDRLWEKVIDGLGYLEDLADLVSGWFKKAPAGQNEYPTQGLLQAGQFNSLLEQTDSKNVVQREEMNAVKVDKLALAEQAQARKTAEQKLPEADVETAAVVEVEDDAESKLAEEALEYFADKYGEIKGKTGESSRIEHLGFLLESLHEYHPKTDLNQMFGSVAFLYEEQVEKSNSKFLSKFDEEVLGKLTEFETRAKELAEAKNQSVQLKR